MHVANITRRETIELIYSRDLFISDAESNSAPICAAHHGVLITSCPDHNGDFHISRHARQVCETGADHDALFLCPFALMDHDDETEVDAQHDEAYARFIDRLIEAARNAHFVVAAGLVGRNDRGLGG